MEHLNDIESDHCLMLVEVVLLPPKTSKPFRFLSFWCSHPEFMGVVRTTWEYVYHLNPLIRASIRLKAVRKSLATWSRATFDDIFLEVHRAEAEVDSADREVGVNDSFHNRMKLNKARAQLKQRISIGEEFWRQESRIKWKMEGEKNTKYFHKCVKSKKNQLSIQCIKKEDGTVIKNHEEIQVARQSTSLIFYLVRGFIKMIALLSVSSR
ncbi:uncharacterized protein M6B38_335620 [Iris pallida]|uniref:Uncharacterized protein n=1 Tax=Iris pallida TaxID=29817 RepID=A0AAX6H1L5_IRIPA|nr:uncharacterized protein M6B38_335620 [Iris pallida]